MRAKQVPPSTDPKILEAEQEAQKMLYAHLRKYHGVQRDLSARTGIQATFLSKLANKPGQVIALETAILIELGTDGELRAEDLCPARADVIAQFLQARNSEKKALAE